jgi:hypothetical protein
MITVKAYLYPNTAEVQVFDPAIFTTRNRQVYSRPIKVYQGIDNPIQVMIKNQDQKSVNLSVPDSDPVEPAYSIVASIQDPTNKKYIIDYSVTFTDITKGLGNFTIATATLAALEQRFYKLTFKKIQLSDTTIKEPLYIDDNYGVPLDLEVLPAYYSTLYVPDIGDDGGTGDGGAGDSDGGGYIP